MAINGTGRDTFPEGNHLNGTNGYHRMNGSNDSNGVNVANGTNGVHQEGSLQTSVQDPIAVVGLACRLPDKCHTPYAFWKFIEGGGIAQNRPPASRFDIDTHVSFGQTSK